APDDLLDEDDRDSPDTFPKRGMQRILFGCAALGFAPPNSRRTRMPEAVIVDTVRTPIGRAFKGSLAQLRPDEMGAYVVDQLLERNPEVDPASVEDLFCGCGMPQGRE